MRLRSLLLSKLFWLLLIFSILVIIRLATGYFSNAVKVYTTSIVRNYAEAMIAEAVDENVVANMKDVNFFIKEMDSDGKVSYAYLNSYVVNKIRNDTIKFTDKAIEKIDSSEDFDSIDIPMGYFFGFRYFFVDKIKVPLKIDVIGNQDVEISVDANDLGINTTMIEINLFVAIDIQVVIPFQENITRTEVTIPLAIEIMNNDVPYYLG